jgi:hypothetical protein
MGAVAVIHAVRVKNEGALSEAAHLLTACHRALEIDRA